MCYFIIIISSSSAVLLNHLKPQGLVPIPNSLLHPTVGVGGEGGVGVSEWLSGA